MGLTSPPPFWTMLKKTADLGDKGTPYLTITIVIIIMKTVLLFLISHHENVFATKPLELWFLASRPLIFSNSLCISCVFIYVCTLCTFLQIYLIYSTIAHAIECFCVWVCVFNCVFSFVLCVQFCIWFCVVCSILYFVVHAIVRCSIVCVCVCTYVCVL